MSCLSKKKDYLYEHLDLPAPPPLSRFLRTPLVIVIIVIVIVLDWYDWRLCCAGKTNMFRYNDPLEAADLRKTMSEKSRKASLMSQSLMSQSLSDLRHPPGWRNSGDWRMFSSDSDIKDIIAEGEAVDTTRDEEEEQRGSQESINTIKNPSAQVELQQHPGSRAVDPHSFF